MRPYMRLFGFAAVCSGVFAGCGTDSGYLPTPTAASPTPQPNPTQHTFTVSGVVSELVGGQAVPLEGAHVEDSERHVFVKTGGDGSYAIADVANTPSLGNAYIYFAKQGYRAQSRQFLLTSDARVDITLVRE